MSKILGKTEKVRGSLLEYMEGFVDNIYSPGEFLPSEILEMILLATVSTGSEIAVFLDRKNRVQAICVGESDHVNLEGFKDARRGTKRLSGIRLWHSHPNGTVMPSEVDLSSLKESRLDACGVIGINTEGEFVTGVSATLLKRDAAGELENTETKGPYRRKDKAGLDMLFGELIRTDKEAEDYKTETAEDTAERAVLAGVILPEDEGIFPKGRELDELGELAETAGALVVASYVQRRPTPDSKYYIGRGLAQEIALRGQAERATLLIVDDELTAGTVRNLEAITGLRVIDRTALILDIFAARAKSREGKLQVELAQQKYRLPRLMGLGTSLSRLGGGIGTRGPGESKLTSDRNHIRRRIAYLSEELDKVSRDRGTIRKERQKNGVPQVAVIGYTNAGKSTMVNRLCNAEVFAEDMLFATLDPSVRRLVTEENRDILLIDTVGFIRKLPHDLVEAFKSTLEELKFADLLLEVVDGSSAEAEEHIKVVRKIVEELGAGYKPLFVAVNKLDEAGSVSRCVDNVGSTEGKTFFVSAKTGEGLPELKNAIMEFFTPRRKAFHLIIPYNEGKTLSYFHENGKISEESYGENGTEISGDIDEIFWKKDFEKFEVK